MARHSADELLKRMPEIPKGSRQLYEAEALFRQLGRLLGEEALDEIVNHYDRGAEGETNQFAVRALGWALAGWMEKDFEGASQALLELQKGLKDEVQENSRSTLEWNGKQVIIPGDFSFVIAQFELIRPAVEAAAKANPEASLDLIRQLPNAINYIGIYTDGLGRRTDWVALEERLRKLEWATEPVPATGQDYITLAVATGWVGWDVEGAVDWFLENNAGSDKGRVSLALQILHSVSDPLQAVAWLRENEGTDTEIDRFLDSYSQKLWPKENAHELHRIIGMPSQEGVRDRILTRFGRPRQVGEGEFEVWFPPETLHSLVTAARLSPENEKRWREAVEANSQLPVVWGN